MTADTPARIALFVAIAENGVIGREGGLPWRLSSDLKLFRKLTMGKPLIMGRKTFVSLGKPLDRRDNIVTTRDKSFVAEGAIIVHSLDEAIARAQDCADRRGVGEIVVIGGAAVYQEALPRANRIYLTRVHAAVTGDVTFPHIDWSQWRQVLSEAHEKSPRDAYPFTFSVMERISGAPKTV